MDDRINTKPSGQMPWLVDISWIGLWPFVVGAGLMVLIELLRLRPPMNAMTAGWSDEFYLVIFLFAATGVAQLIWMRTRNQVRFLQFSLAQLFWLITLVALVLGASGFAEHYGPLRFAFQAHLSEFDRLADEAVRRPSSIGAVPPFTIGPYEIHEIRVIDNHVVFCLNKWFGKADFYGFARLPRCETDDDARKAIGNSYSLVMRLKNDWFVVFDSYWFYKDGWS